MKVLIADIFSDKVIQDLRAEGMNVAYEPKLKDEALKTYMSTNQPHVLVVRSTKVTKELMELDPALELIVRAGSGYDNIDVKEASNRGIFVSTCPGMNAIAVAELVIGLIISIDRRIPDNVNDLRIGQWNKELYSKSEGICGKTIGLIGLGYIGKEMIPRARALGMRVVAYSPSLDEETASRLKIKRAASIVDLCRECDIVSVHVPANDNTKNMINAEVFGAMKRGAIFINTSRWTVVDESAMVEAMEKNGLRVGTDVMSSEPQAKSGAFEHPLFKYSNCYGTHHIGASTQQAEDAVGAEAARIIRQFIADGHAVNCVNMAHYTEQNVTTFIVRHFNRVGVLSAVFSTLKSAHWNVLDMDNVVFQGAHTCCARIRAAVPAESNIDQVLTELKQNSDVIFAGTLQ